MHKTLSLMGAIVLTGALTASAPALAGDAEAGKAKIGTCVACHGKDGKATIPNYPNLMCQNEKYLVDAIGQYKSGARNNPLMKPMVATLSDEDVANVAAYYASQPCK